MRSISAFAAAIATVLALGATSATAETFCVHKSGCSGVEKDTLSEALNAANAQSGPHSVQLGPGTYVNTVSAINERTEIIGSGRDQTKITSGVTDATLDFTVGVANGSVLQNVTVEAGPGKSALAMPSGTINGVRATSSDINVDGAPLVIAQGSTEISNTDIDGSKRDDRTTLASIIPPGSVVSSHVRVMDSSITGAVGVWSCEPAPNSIGIRRSTITSGTRTATVINGAELNMQDVVITNEPTSSALTGNGSVVLNSIPQDAIFTGCPSSSAAAASATTTANIRNVTQLNKSTENYPAYIAFGACTDSSSGTNQNCELNVRDSIVRGYPNLGFARSFASGTGTIDGSYINTDGTTAGNGVFNLQNLVNQDPGFLDSERSDYRLRFNSAMIDTATPGGLEVNESSTDIRSQSRIVDGTGSGVARRDMGAFEYQRQAPTLTASASPNVLKFGQPVRYSANASDIDGGAVGYEWHFEDGTKSTNASVEKVYKTGGIKTATVTATSTAGVKSTQTVRVDVPVPTVSMKVGKFTVKSKILTKKGQLPVDVTLAENAALAVGATTQVRKLGRKTKSGKRKRGKIVNVPVGTSGTVQAKRGTTRVTVKLNRTGKKLLKDVLRRKRKNLVITLNANAKNQIGNTATSSTKLSIKAAKKKRARK